MEFTDFVKKNNPKQWEKLPHDIRYKSRRYILENEQNRLCGYTEISLNEESNSYHIDHFEKREHNQNKIFDWNNLIVSTSDEDYGGKYKDNQYKIKSNGYGNIFNPVVEDMSQYLQYYEDGEIAAKEGIDPKIKQKVEETIKAFNLNHKTLTHKRKDLLIELEIYKDQKELLKDLDVKNAYANRGFISLWNWYMKNIDTSK